MFTVFFFAAAIALLIIIPFFIPITLPSVFILVPGAFSIFPVNRFLRDCLSGSHPRLVDAVGAEGVSKMKINRAIRFSEDNRVIEVTTIIIIKSKVLFITFLSLISLNPDGSFFVK